MTSGAGENRASSVDQAAAAAATIALQEAYLDSAKLAYIQSWVHTVNRVQSVEGKWTDTINKIAFYD
jgi:hypothetical protein